jgi:hypothetical protein
MMVRSRGEDPCDRNEMQPKPSADSLSGDVFAQGTLSFLLPTRHTDGFSATDSGWILAKDNDLGRAAKHELTSPLPTIESSTV